MTRVEPATLCLARGRTTSGSLRSPVEPGACRVKGESGLKSLCRDRDSNPDAREGRGFKTAAVGPQMCAAAAPAGRRADRAE